MAPLRLITRNEATAAPLRPMSKPSSCSLSGGEALWSWGARGAPHGDSWPPYPTPSRVVSVSAEKRGSSAGRAVHAGVWREVPPWPVPTEVLPGRFAVNHGVPRPGGRVSLREVGAPSSWMKDPRRFIPLRGVGRESGATSKFNDGSHFVSLSSLVLTSRGFCSLGFRAPVSVGSCHYRGAGGRVLGFRGKWAVQPGEGEEPLWAQSPPVSIAATT